MRCQAIRKCTCFIGAVTPAHEWALTAWLVPAGDTWQVASFYVTISGIAGHDAARLQQLAVAQAGQGHAFNAYMLMSAASATAYRGPDFQPILKPRIDAALAALKVPAELSGNPPRTWKFGANAYSVEQVTIVGAGEAAWPRHSIPRRKLELDRSRRRNAQPLADRRVRQGASRLEPSFGFIVARILRPGENMGWGTVFDTKAGFAQGAPAAVAP